MRCKARVRMMTASALMSAASVATVGCGQSERGGSGASMAGIGAEAGSAAVGGSAGGGGGSAGSGAAGAGGDSDFYIRGLVNGELVDARQGAGAYFWQGIQMGTLGSQATTAERRWFLLTDNSSAALNACNSGYMLLATVPDDPDATLLSITEGSSCTAKITQEAPSVGDVLEGTFSAELTNLNGTLHATVTEGRFRVPRADGRPPR